MRRWTPVSVHALGPHDYESPMRGREIFSVGFSLLPGIVSTSDVSSKFYVRGGAGDQNLILLDGMKMYNPYHAFGVFSVFDPDLINTTEVFTGAFPAGYGNRLSSVVNMTTKQGNTSRIAGRAEVNLLNAKLLLVCPMSGDNSWLVNGRTSLSDRALKHFVRNPAPVSFYDLFVKATLGNETGRNSFRGFFSGDNVRSEKPDEPDFSWTSQAMAASLSGLASDRIYVDGVVYTSSFRVRRDAKASTSVLPADSRIGDDGVRMDMTIHTASSGTWRTGLQFDLPELEFTYATRANTVRTYASVDSEIAIWLRHLLEVGTVQTDIGLHVDVTTLFANGPGVQAFQLRERELGVVRSVAHDVFSRRVQPTHHHDQQ